MLFYGGAMVWIELGLKDLCVRTMSPWWREVVGWKPVGDSEVAGDILLRKKLVYLCGTLNWFLQDDFENKGKPDSLIICCISIRQWDFLLSRWLLPFWSWPLCCPHQSWAQSWGFPSIHQNCELDKSVFLFLCKLPRDFVILAENTHTRATGILRTLPFLSKFWFQNPSLSVLPETMAGENHGKHLF